MKIRCENEKTAPGDVYRAGIKKLMEKVQDPDVVAEKFLDFSYQDFDV